MGRGMGAELGGGEGWEEGVCVGSLDGSLVGWIEGWVVGCAEGGLERTVIFPVSTSAKVWVSDDARAPEVTLMLMSVPGQDRCPNNCK